MTKQDVTIDTNLPIVRPRTITRRKIKAKGVPESVNRCGYFSCISASVTTCLIVLSSRFYFWKNRLRRRTPRWTVMGTTDRRRVSF